MRDRDSHRDDEPARRKWTVRTGISHRALGGGRPSGPAWILTAGPRQESRPRGEGKPEHHAVRPDRIANQHPSAHCGYLHATTSARCGALAPRDARFFHVGHLPPYPRGDGTSASIGTRERAECPASLREPGRRCSGLSRQSDSGRSTDSITVQCRPNRKIRLVHSQTGSSAMIGTKGTIYPSSHFVRCLAQEVYRR